MWKLFLTAAVLVTTGTAIPALAVFEEPYIPTKMIENTIIVPGRSVGDVVLGKPVPQSFIKLLPPPSPWMPDYCWGGEDGTDVPPYFFIDTATGRKSGVVTAFGIQGRPDGWPDFRTKEGIGLGSTFTAVKRAYPKGKLLPPGMDIDCSWEIAPGPTRFDFYGGYVSAIIIGRID